MVDKLKIFGDKGKKNKELSFYFIKDIAFVLKLDLALWIIFNSKLEEHDALGNDLLTLRNQQRTIWLLQ